MGQDVAIDQLGDEFKGYVVRIGGGNDKQGFPMKQGELILDITAHIEARFGDDCWRRTPVYIEMDCDEVVEEFSGTTTDTFYPPSNRPVHLHSPLRDFPSSSYPYSPPLGVLLPTRVRLLLGEGQSCYRQRRTGERRRKSVRGCIVGADIQALHLIVVKQGDNEIPGLTDADSTVPKRLGPKRANRKCQAIQEAVWGAQMSNGVSPESTGSR